MTKKFTLQSLVDKTRAANARAIATQQQQTAARQKELEQSTIEQYNSALEQHIYLTELFTVIGDPEIEYHDDSTALLTQRAKGIIEEVAITVQIEKYTNDDCIYLRLIHVQSANYTCLRIDHNASADTVLQQIAADSTTLLTAIRHWEQDQRDNHQIAQQIITNTCDWHQLVTTWDNQCIQIAEAMLVQQWQPHMLFRLMYVATASLTEADEFAFDASWDDEAAAAPTQSIVTCNEPGTNRISYISITPTGDHTIKIIPGGLLSYEPLIFDTKPQLNQSIPYHIRYHIGDHLICLPPCNTDAHKLPPIPPAPPPWRDYLITSGLDPAIAHRLETYFQYDNGTEDAIAFLIASTPEQLIELNPAYIFA